MKKILTFPIFFCLVSIAYAQLSKVEVKTDATGSRLQVDGMDFMINGMNWDYFPIGTTVTYSLWTQPDAFIQQALDREMGYLKNMGVNTVRMYTGVPAKWIQYIYENYGIYTMLNHPFGRYGLTINGNWVPVTNYADPTTRQILLSEVRQLATDYGGTPGLLMYLLGNENNYGLFWAGAETEDFPDEEDQRRAVGNNRGRPMYKLMNEAALAMKAIHSSVPVAICNGDLLFIEIIAEECPDVDIYGTNMYRGVSFGDAFQRVKNEYGKPIMFTEFGADAFNAITNAEDQESQAYYMLGNWKEIYENAAGLGKAANSLGGFTFQFSDGWWKTGQTVDLDLHSSEASWSNGGYARDFVEGENNMNEEWFGVCAKGSTDAEGYYDLYPRAAYYALKEAHRYDPYDQNASLSGISEHFANIGLMDAVLRARGDKAALGGGQTQKLSVSELRTELTTFYTDGHLITTPENPNPTTTTRPDQLGFDRMESFFVGFEARPTESVRANVSFNVLGNVPTNPINEIFYENRGVRQAVVTRNPGSGGSTLDLSPNRVQVYQAEAEWKSKYFDMKYFYRTGHYHWGYEGDFFGFYPEANYGPNIDLYNGFAPHGVEIKGKKNLDGLKVAFGPELWWGANPAILLKYTKHVGKYKVTGIFHEDLDQNTGLQSSLAVPQPKTRRASLYATGKLGKLGVEVGGIWGGTPLIGKDFQVVRGDSEANYVVLQDQVRASDTWGGKVKLTYEHGSLKWYGLASSIGLVANYSTGAFGNSVGAATDATQTFTGWKLKEAGGGNSNSVLTGVAYTIGKWQIAPNFQWQMPMIDPIPADAPEPARSRNILFDPFVTRSSREMTGGEVLFTFDPTPATWMYQWDNDRAEDAKFAASFGFVYRNYPTTQDASVIFPGTGRIPTAATSAPPALDLWEAHARLVSKIKPGLGMVVNLYGGNGQANGPNSREIRRYGGDLRLIYKKTKLITEMKIDDWGPFDYHRDFNLTFPMQLMTDISITAGKPDWFILPSTRMGIRYTFRTLNEFSPRYIFQDELVPPGVGNGNEWEIRTYLHINIGN